MSKLLFCTLLTFALGSELIFVAELSRHGARAPEIMYPFLANDWSQDDLAELTAQGMRQHYLLGTEFRQRYIINTQLLSANYDPAEIVVKSSDYNRTIVSALSQLQGLYPEATGPALNTQLSSRPPITITNVDQIEKDLGTSTLPNRIQMIPVHTIPETEDYLFRGYKESMCKKQDDYKDDIEADDAYQSLEKYWQQNLFPQINAILGTNIKKIKDCHQLAKDLACDNFAGFGLHGLTQQQFDQIQSVHNYYRIHIPFDKHKGRRLASSTFFHDLLYYMDNALSGKNPKFVFYSGHDGTQVAILTSLGYTPPSVPSFASTILFELYSDRTVKVLYNDQNIGYGSCTSACSIDVFKQVVSDYLVDDIVKECED